MTLKSAVFVDVDLTLLRCASFRLFILELYRQTTLQCKLRLLLWYACRRAGMLNALQFKEHCLSLLQGKSLHELRQMGRDFSHRHLTGQLRSKARDCLQQHKNDGRSIYLISASPFFYVEPLSRLLSLDGAFATHLQFDEKSIFTGNLSGRECLAEEKVARVRYFCEPRKIDLQNCFYYADSVADLPLMKHVGHPVAIWPDWQLYRSARERKWPIEYW